MGTQKKASRKPWYLMGSRRETERSLLMKADDVQRALPRRLKDYNRNTTELRERAQSRKREKDPFADMKRYLGKTSKDSARNERNERARKERPRKQRTKKSKSELKKERKALLRSIRKERKKQRKKERADR